jgi:hypothetical protein
VLTGTSTAIVTTLVFIFLLLFDTSKTKTAIILLVLCSLCLVALFFVYNDELKIIFRFIQQKWNELIQLIEKTLLFSDTKTESSSFRARERQISRYLINLQPTEILFGKGKFGINYHEEMVEMMYFLVLYDYGIVGLFFLMLILVRAFFLSFFNFIRTRHTIQLIAVLSFSIYGITLHPVITVNMGGMFAFLFYFSFFQIDNKNV